MSNIRAMIYNIYIYQMTQWSIRMAVRTYIPTFIRTLKLLCVYLVRYRSTIEKYAPVGSAAVLDAFELACHNVIEQIPVEPLP